MGIEEGPLLEVPVYWTWFDWISRIGAGLEFLLALLVALIALGVAIMLTRQRLCREAAWLLALGWLATVALTVVQLIIDQLLMRALGWGVGQWFTYGVDLLTLCSFGIMAAGLFMLRPARGARS